MKYILTTIAIWMMVANFLQAEPLKGRVMLREGSPAQFATVFVPSLGIGTITDTEGNYYLEKVLGKGSMIEFSYLGYTTHVANADTLVKENTLQTITLHEQPIALNEVFVTPNGEDPATYIFRKINEKAAANRKLLQYDATINSSFLTQDLDIIPMILPKMVLWMVKGAMAMTSAGKMFGFCIEHEKIEAKGSIRCHSQKGKCKYEDWKMLETTLSDKDFDKALKEQTSIDPFLFVYENFMNAKKLPNNYTLKGTIEEDGRTIDVLCRTSDFQIHDGKVTGDTTYLYVVEEDWGILRREERSASGLTRLECRNNGQGIWLPISYVDDPTVMDINDAMKEALEDYEKEEKNGKLSRMDRKVLNRVRDIANGNRKFRPCLTMCYYLQYP